MSKGQFRLMLLVVAVSGLVGGVLVSWLLSGSGGLCSRTGWEDLGGRGISLG